MEKAYSSFKPVDYDLSAQLKAIDAFEEKAVASAKETTTKIDAELKDLNSTLSNIKDARGFEDLTLQDIAKARPQIPQTVDTMLEKGKWTVPGYKEKFGDLSMCSLTLAVSRRTHLLSFLLQMLCKRRSHKRPTMQYRPDSELHDVLFEEARILWLLWLRTVSPRRWGAYFLVKGLHRDTEPARLCRFFYLERSLSPHVIDLAYSIGDLSCENELLRDALWPLCRVLDAACDWKPFSSDRAQLRLLNQGFCRCPEPNH